MILFMPHRYPASDIETIVIELLCRFRAEGEPHGRESKLLPYVANESVLFPQEGLALPTWTETKRAAPMTPIQFRDEAQTGCFRMGDEQVPKTAILKRLQEFRQIPLLRSA